MNFNVRNLLQITLLLTFMMIQTLTAYDFNLDEHRFNATIGEQQTVILTFKIPPEVQEHARTDYHFRIDHPQGVSFKQFYFIHEEGSNWSGKIYLHFLNFSESWTGSYEVYNYNEPNASSSQIVNINSIGKPVVENETPVEVQEKDICHWLIYVIPSAVAFCGVLAVIIAILCTRRKYAQKKTTNSPKLNAKKNPYVKEGATTTFEPSRPPPAPPTQKVKTIESNLTVRPATSERTTSLNSKQLQGNCTMELSIPQHMKQYNRQSMSSVDSFDNDDEEDYVNTYIPPYQPPILAKQQHNALPAGRSKPYNDFYPTATRHPSHGPGQAGFANPPNARDAMTLPRINRNMGFPVSPRQGTKSPNYRNMNEPLCNEELYEGMASQI